MNATPKALILRDFFSLVWDLVARASDLAERFPPCFGKLEVSATAHFQPAPPGKNWPRGWVPFQLTASSPVEVFSASDEASGGMPPNSSRYHAEKHRVDERSRSYGRGARFSCGAGPGGLLRVPFLILSVLLLGSCSGHRWPEGGMTEAGFSPFKLAHSELHGAFPEDAVWPTASSEDPIVGVVVGIERASCYGTCPVYTTVYSDTGQACYCGINFIEPLGVFSGTIEPELVRQVAKFAGEIGFLEMPHSFFRFTTDGPSTFPLVCAPDGEQLLHDYDGGGPATVWALEQLVDSLYFSARWHRETHGSCEACLDRILSECSSIRTVRPQ